MRTTFASGVVLLILAAAGLYPSTPGQALSHGTMDKLRGANSSQNGSGNYDCDDVQATNSQANDISSYACTQTPNASIPGQPSQQATCVDCRNGTYTTGRWFTHAGTPLVFVKNVTCTGDLWTAGTCGAGANGFGTCGGPDSGTGNSCTGSFPDYDYQNPPEVVPERGLF